MESTSELLPVAGQCLCGAVRFEIVPPTLFCAHCHCSMCRRAHGAAYVTWFGVPYERFRIVAGDDTLVRHRSSDHCTRSFCGTCGSSLFFEAADHPDWIDVVLANMQGALDQAPQGHFYFDDRADWVEVADELPRFGGETGLEAM